MALEVKVYREIKDYQARVLFGMSWRQILVAAVFLPVVFGAYFLCYFAGLEDLGSYLVIFLSLPGVALGWVRPQGIVFEKYVGYWWAHRQGRKVYVFDQEKLLNGKNDEDFRREKVDRRRVGRFEAGC